MTHFRFVIFHVRAGSAAINVSIFCFFKKKQMQTTVRSNEGIRFFITPASDSGFVFLAWMSRQMRKAWRGFRISDNESKSFSDGPRFLSYEYLGRYCC